MADANGDLHGSAPDNCPVALVLVDTVNPLEFPEADRLLRFAIPAADRLAELKLRAKRFGVPTIFANDNFGRWRSDLAAVVERCREPGCKGFPLVERLLPEADDYFVLKPKPSAFFATAMEPLLRHLGTRVLVLGGFAADICVLLSAGDAYLRDYRLVVPSDGVASNEAVDCDAALALMRRVLKAQTPPAVAIDFEVLKRTA